MSSKILILSGEIKSGKTTKLFKWALSKKNVGGILQPVVNEKRFLYSLSEKSLIQLEVDEGDLSKFRQEEIIRIGHFNFLKEAFTKAQKVLIDCLNGNFDWLVIDEIGPLELRDEGLEPAIKYILNNANKFNGKIVLVVRNKLLNDVIKKYELENSFDEFNAD